MISIPEINIFLHTLKMTNTVIKFKRLYYCAVIKIQLPLLRT